MLKDVFNLIEVIVHTHASKQKNLIVWVIVDPETPGLGWMSVSVEGELRES